MEEETKQIEDLDNTIYLFQQLSDYYQNITFRDTILKTEIESKLNELISTNNIVSDQIFESVMIFSSKISNEIFIADLQKLIKDNIDEFKSSMEILKSIN